METLMIFGIAAGLFLGAGVYNLSRKAKQGQIEEDNKAEHTRSQEEFLLEERTKYND